MNHFDFRFSHVLVSESLCKVSYYEVKGRFRYSYFNSSGSDLKSTKERTNDGDFFDKVLYLTKTYRPQCRSNFAPNACYDTSPTPFSIFYVLRVRCNFGRPRNRNSIETASAILFLFWGRVLETLWEWLTWRKGRTSERRQSPIKSGHIVKWMVTTRFFTLPVIPFTMETLSPITTFISTTRKSVKEVSWPIRGTSTMTSVWAEGKKWDHNTYTSILTVLL